MTTRGDKARRAAVQWYADLQRGSGAAADLDPELRSALLEVTARKADEQAAADQAGRDALAKAADRHDAPGSLRLYLRMLGISVIVSFVTPIVASFGTLAIPNMSAAVFTQPDKNGRTTGDAPYALYGHIAVTLVLFCSAVLAINLLFGLRVRFPAFVVVAAIAGLGVAGWALATVGGAFWEWDVLPTTVALGHLLAQVCTTLSADVAASRGRRATRATSS